MAVTTVARIQHRRGVKDDLPPALHEGELGFCLDTQELFIGNSPAVGGNTQILTSNVNLAQIVDYQFKSDTSVISQTGTSMNQPILRALQLQLDDQMVNVKAYGAQGDGITDDTASIQRAITDLYTKVLPLTENPSQSKKQIWFPAGKYRVTDTLLIYPGVHLCGEGAHNTQITLDVPVPDPVPACMVKLTDSLGQTDASLGDNGAQLPTHIQIQNLSFHSTRSLSVSLWLLQRCAHILFHMCEFEGVWQPGDPVVPGTEQAGVVVDTLGGAIITQDIKFINCVFKRMEWAYFCKDPAQVVLFDQCEFSQLFKGIITLERVAPDPNPNSGPAYTKVSNSRFVDVDDYGIQVMQSAPGVTSLHNTFQNVGVTSMVTCVLWGALSNNCVSMNDLFDVVSAISNLGTDNLIVNTQQNNLSATASASALQVDTTATSTNAVYYPAILANGSGLNSVETGALLTFNPSMNQLGVGTGAPAYNLHVVGDARVTGDLISASRYRNMRIPTGVSPYTDTVQAADDVIVIRTLTDTVQVDLPAGLNGRTLVIKDGENNAAVNNITIQPAGGDAVDTGAPGAPYVINTNNTSVTLMFDGTLNRWHII